MEEYGSWRRTIDATRFLSRLPLPDPKAPGPSLGTTLGAAPWAGLLIAAGPALLLIMMSRLGLPALAAAIVAVMGLVLVTGGLHEDGLADLADGFGGGASVSRKLAIMRDSRIGSFGALALTGGLLLRVAALQGLIERGGAGATALALLGAAALSRGFMLLPLALLPPARPDGLASIAAATGEESFGRALAVAATLGTALAWRVEPDKLQVAAATLAALAAALGLARLARHHLRGVTGDVIGATQQVSEMTFLLVLCAGAGAR